MQTAFPVCLCGGRKKPPQRQTEKCGMAMRDYMHIATCIHSFALPETQSKHITVLKYHYLMNQLTRLFYL